MREKSLLLFTHHASNMQHINEDQLFAYIDDELSPAERRDVAVHLATCATCAAQLTEWKAMLGDVEALPDVALTVDLSARVVEALEAETELVNSPAVGWLAVVEVLIAAVVLAVGWPLVRTVVGNLQVVVDASVNSADVTWSNLTLPILDAIDNGQAAINTLPTASISLTLSLILLAIFLLIWLASTRLALRDLEVQP